MDDLSALEQLLKSGEFLHHLDMDSKTSDLVFDRRTLKALYETISRYNVDYVDYPISSGKESVVFKAYISKKPIAIKIYKMSTLKFSNIWRYIEGDYRFADERLSRSSVLYVWARKEYTNLKECQLHGIEAPRPIAVNRNILLMSYLGTARKSAPMIKNIDVDFQLLYKQTESLIKRVYLEAHLIHADLSEYNIMYYRKRPYILDMGQSVTWKHPSARFFLERDLKNVFNFFRKKGVDCDPDKFLKDLTDAAEIGKD
jgi:RIO kinase 1